MSTLNVGTLKNNGSAVDFPNGVTVGGGDIVQGYTVSNTEPGSPSTGDLWWNASTSVLKQYLGGAFREIGLNVFDILNLSNWSYQRQISIGSKTSNLTDCYFKPDGTKLYVSGWGSESAIYQYNLSTAWDLSTATYFGKGITNSPASHPQSIYFRSNGLVVMLTDNNDDRVYQFHLSTAWNITTLSFSGKWFSTANQEVHPDSLWFKDDGLRFYVLGQGQDTVYQYSLSTAWVINSSGTNTAYPQTSFSISSQETAPRGLTFSDDGLNMYIIGSSNNKIYRYTLSTAWWVNTSTYSGDSLSISGNVRGLFLDDAFEHVYVVKDTGEYVSQYDIAQS